MNDATKRKEREMVQKEIDKLRGSIQTLTRSANPLGESVCLMSIIYHVGNYCRVLLMIISVHLSVTDLVTV